MSIANINVMQYPSILNTATKRRRFRAYLSTNGRCCYCYDHVWLPEFGIIGPKEKRATIEHKIPKEFNGTNDVENITCSCNECNSFRGSIPHDDFAIIRKLGWSWRWYAGAYKTSIDKATASGKKLKYVRLVKPWGREQNDTAIDALKRREHRITTRKRNLYGKIQYAENRIYASMWRTCVYI